MCLNNRSQAKRYWRHQCNSSSPSIVNVNVEQTVLAIINDVKIRGDEALCHYAEKFDGLFLKIFISDAEIDEAYNSCEADLIEAMERAPRQVTIPQDPIA